MMTEQVPIFPRIMDCFPSMKTFPGCSVVPGEILTYQVTYQSNSRTPSTVVPPVSPAQCENQSTRSESCDEEEIAIPSGMPQSTKHADLPTVPPPSEYWKLKRLDHSANVMDYWIKSSQEWDISGLESDAKLADSSR